MTETTQMPDDLDAATTIMFKRLGAYGLESKPDGTWKIHARIGNIFVIVERTNDEENPYRGGFVEYFENGTFDGLKFGFDTADEAANTATVLAAIKILGGDND